MDTALPHYDEENASSWLTQLNAFIEDNAANHAYSEKYGSDAVKAFVSLLCEKIVSTEESAVAGAQLFALRLCCREPALAVAVSANKTFVAQLVWIAHLHSAEAKPDEQQEKLLKLGEDHQSQDESTKLLVNIVFRDPSSRRALIDANIISSLKTRLSAKDLADEDIFPLARLALHLANEESILESDQLLTTEWIVLLGDLLGRLTAKAKVPACSLGLIEVLKLIFTITIPLGPMGKQVKPSPEMLQAHRKLVQLYQDLLFDETQDATFHRIRLNVVNCLINVPGETTPWFAPEQTLQALFALMHAIIFSVPKDENGRRSLDTDEIDGTLTPVLLVLTSISKAIPRARMILRQLVFPPELLDPSAAPLASKEEMKTGKGIDPPRALVDSDTIAKHLVNVMCSFRTGLKHHASDFLFVLCNSDPNELVRMTGLGPAAGHLQFLGALAQAAATGAKSPSGPMRPEDMPDLSGVKPGDDISKLLGAGAGAAASKEDDPSSTPAAAEAPKSEESADKKPADSASD